MLKLLIVSIVSQFVLNTRGTTVNEFAEQFMRNPQPLEPFWWTSESFRSSQYFNSWLARYPGELSAASYNTSSSEACRDRNNVFLDLEGEYGRTNNIILEIARFLLFVTAHTNMWPRDYIPTSGSRNQYAPRYVAILSSPVFTRSVGSLLNWQRATRGWICILSSKNELPRSYRGLTTLNMKAAYYWPHEAFVRSDAMKTVVGHLLLHPSKRLRAAVKANERIYPWPKCKCV